MISNRGGRRKLLERGGALHRHWPWIVASGVVCAAGYLSNQSTVPDFYPSGYLPNGVRLSGYCGEGWRTADGAAR